MLQAVERGARRQHPARENLALRLIRTMVDHFDERRRLGRLAGWGRVAVPRSNRESREPHRNSDRRKHICWPAGDLVETAQNHGALSAVLSWNSVCNRQRPRGRLRLHIKAGRRTHLLAHEYDAEKRSNGQSTSHRYLPPEFP
jgi:hypothetical protein